MDPRPDHGEQSYCGQGRLEGKAAVITGGDSAIGRAVAIAFAREVPAGGFSGCPHRSAAPSPPAMSGRSRNASNGWNPGRSGHGRTSGCRVARPDVLISYLSEDDARASARVVEEAGRKAVLLPGDISRPKHCRDMVDRQ